MPVMGSKASKKHSDSARSANYGVCASRNMKYFDYKLVAISTLDEVPVVCDFVPANIDERDAAEIVLFYLRGPTFSAIKALLVPTGKAN